jgi:3,4-dihydroxy 2-butanone 4-phosphate synthase/GTP cyclohydrolase II
VLAGDETQQTVLARLARQPAAPAADAAQQPAWRELGVGAQILADLGVHRLHVMGTPRNFVGLAGFGLEIVDYV